ncbi:hypothetical protein BGZ65_010304 [Modicella reniformis]|uniref:Uncharacterized protein n=1 Tax=Modicella reniformis TaxID=1440133 RepID=A0A9P6LTH3_9FUNG|nr:hypothetical protein BGZ65_010304 [Modicella reniformis]
MDTSKELPQAFRTKSEITTIPSQVDTKTGQRFVLWRDIQQKFGNLQAVLNNGQAVVFLRDDNLEETHKRIAYHPDIVLEVVVANVAREPDVPKKRLSQKSTATGSNRSPRSSRGSFNDKPKGRVVDAISRSKSSNIPPTSWGSHTETGFPSQHKMGFGNGGSSSTGGMTSSHSEPIASKIQSTYRQQYGSFVEAIKEGREELATTIRDDMNEHLVKTRTELGKDAPLQDLVVRMLHMQEDTQHQLLEMRQQMEANQRQMIHMQQQAFDRLAVIQSCVQAIVTQTYELHEYPIPRLFIVLPKTIRRRDRFLKPFAEHFRLYFLCECGAHTVPGSSRTQHEIHLAKHEGYDLDKPNEFFEKYGSYVLTLMYMIKYGIKVAGLSVPPMANFDGFGTSQKRLVDESINFLQELKGTSTNSTGGDGEATRLYELEVMKRADLRQLESHLKVKDEHRVLGNLYRIVTPEGHVKWVCIDHYRTKYRESASRRLREIVEVNGGDFKENLGEIWIELNSNTFAKQFYRALVDARGVPTLSISLQWEVTMDDLRKLADAATKANIVDLTINGKAFLGRTPDILHRNDRFDPIMELRANGCLRTLRLVMFKDLFRRIGSNAFISAPKLRVLKIDSPFDAEAATWQSNVKNILRSNPQLRDLGLRIQRQRSLVNVMRDILRTPRSLENLDLYYGHYCTTARVIDGQVQTIQLFLPSTEDHAPKNQTLNEELILNQVHEILQLSPTLSVIRIGYPTAKPNDMIQIIASTRYSLVITDTGTALHTVELVYLQNRKGARPVGITVDFTGSEGRHDFSIDVNMVPQVGFVNSYYDILYDYGWPIKALDAGNGTIDDEFAQQIDKIMERKDPKLRSLILDTRSLSKKGLEHMERVISRSESLDRFIVDCQFLNIESEREKASWLLSRHSNKLTGLSFQEDGSDQVKSWLVETFPTRQVFPKLTDLHLVLPYNSEYENSNPAYVSWLSNMVSAPCSPQMLFDVLECMSSTSKTWLSLKGLSIQLNTLKQEEWETVIQAIDFSMLEALDLTGTNFDVVQFDCLINRLGNEVAPPLRFLDLSLSLLSKNAHFAELPAKVKAFKECAPRVTIKGLENIEVV